MGFIRQAGKACLAACLPARRFLVRGSVTSPSQKPALSLTFDDGPDPTNTPRLLDLMAEFGLHGTFFVLGRKVAAEPALARRIAAEGHEIGNHTWSHAKPDQIGAAEFLREVEDTARLIQDVCGVDCRLTRPPQGKLTWGKVRGLWRLRQTVVLWNVDSKDYAMSDPGQMRAWCGHYRPRHGDILLFHDNHPFGAVGLRELNRGRVFEQFRCTTISTWLTGRAV